MTQDTGSGNTQLWAHRYTPHSHWSYHNIITATFSLPRHHVLALIKLVQLHQWLPSRCSEEDWLKCVYNQPFGAHWSQSSFESIGQHGSLHIGQPDWCLIWNSSKLYQRVYTRRLNLKASYTKARRALSYTNYRMMGEMPSTSQCILSCPMEELCVGHS